MRRFPTGATRNNEVEGGVPKPDYHGFLSPLVIKRYGEYMNKHRIQADGTLRDSDNWKKLFGEQHYDVCMKSAWRHFFSMWMAHDGYTTEEDIEDSAMALLFNITAYMHKRLSQDIIDAENDSL